MVPILAPIAAMEPGHEDREDPGRVERGCGREVAAMEPGHEDREDRSLKAYRLTCEDTTGRER